MKNDSSGYGRQFIGPMILTAATIFLGFISFHTVFPDYPFFRKLYYTFQLFTLESGDRFYENGPQSLWTVITFNIARYLAVATLVLTIVLAILSVLRYKYYLTRVRYMKGHSIICGLGEVGEAIVSSSQSKKRLVIIEKDTSNENLTGLKKEGVKVIEANALDKTVLGKIGIDHAKSFAAVTGDDFVNLTLINQALEMLRVKGLEDLHVNLIANITSRNLKAAIIDEWNKERGQTETELRKKLRDFREAAVVLKEHGGFNTTEKDKEEYFNTCKSDLENYNPSGNDFKKCKGNLKIFNINQLAARYIFRNYPPDRFRNITKSSDTAMNILILGFSRIGEELFKLCVQNCHYINRKKTRITLVAFEADELQRKVKSVYSNISKLIEFIPVNMNPHHLTGKLLTEYKLEDVDVVYICSGEDHYQSSYSLRIRELFADRKGISVIRPFYSNRTWNTKNYPPKLYTFNILDKVAVLEDIIKECFDRKAIAVHHRWMKLAVSEYIIKTEVSITENLEIPHPKPTLVPWHMLDEETRDDNRSVVEHINVKLRSMGELADPEMYDTPEMANSNYSFILKPDLVKQLAETEHLRWMATKYLYGWNPGPERNIFHREHESLKEFSQLNPVTQNYDMDQVRQIHEIVHAK